MQMLTYFWEIMKCTKIYCSVYAEVYGITSGKQPSEFLKRLKDRVKNSGQLM